MYVGTYTGNNTARSITGVGFQPKAVFIFSDDTATAGDIAGGVWACDTMQTNYAGHLKDNARSSSGVTSYDADGFSLAAGAFLNVNGATYYFVALSSDEVYSGNYTGNGTDNRAITGIGFAPGAVFIQKQTSTPYNPYTVWATTEHPEGYSGPTGPVAYKTGIVSVMGSDGFTINNNTDAAFEINYNAQLYAFIAIKASADIVIGSYTGNGVDDRAVTGVGFQPYAVFIKNGSNNVSVFRTRNMSGDLTGLSTSRGGLVANYIQSLDEDGFTVGSENSVNANSYWTGYIAFGTAASGGATPTLPPYILKQHQWNAFQWR